MFPLINKTIPFVKSGVGSTDMNFIAALSLFPFFSECMFLY